MLEGINGNTRLATAEQSVARGGIDESKEEESTNVGIADGPVLEEAAEYGAPGVEEVHVPVRIGHYE